MSNTDGDDIMGSLYKTITATITDLGLSTSSCPYSPEDLAYLARVKDSKTITNFSSNIGMLNKNGPYCVRVSAETNDQQVKLTKCTNAESAPNAVAIWAKLSNGKPAPTTPSPFFDNRFYLNESTGQIMSVRDKKGCLYVDETSHNPTADSYKLKYKADGCDTKKVNQRFTADPNFHQISSKAFPTHCITAKGLVAKMAANYHKDHDNPSDDIPDIELTMEKCPDMTLDQFTPLTDLGDSMFIYGDPPGNLFGTMYVNLATKYAEFVNQEASDIKDIEDKYKAAAQGLFHELAIKDANINNLTEENRKFQDDLANTEKRSFDLIRAQTISILAKIDSIKNMNFTEHKQNSYQLEQNEQIKKVHSFFFWTYFVAVFLFLLIYGIQIGFFTLFFLAAVICTICYPFLIIYIEYGLVYMYYYVESMLIGKPFVVNKLPIMGHLG